LTASSSCLTPLYEILERKESSSVSLNKCGLKSSVVKLEQKKR